MLKNALTLRTLSSEWDMYSTIRRAMKSSLETTTCFPSCFQGWIFNNTLTWNAITIINFVIVETKLRETWLNDGWISRTTSQITRDSDSKSFRRTSLLLTFIFLSWFNSRQILSPEVFYLQDSLLVIIVLSHSQFRLCVVVFEVSTWRFWRGLFLQHHRHVSTLAIWTWLSNVVSWSRWGIYFVLRWTTSFNIVTHKIQTYVNCR